MSTETGLITGGDMLLIIEALDEYVKRGRDPAPHERQDYTDFERLVGRLKHNAGTGWSEGSRWWLTGVLRKEREGFSDTLRARMLLLLRSPAPMTRGQFREALLETLKELRDVSFYEAPRS